MENDQPSGVEAQDPQSALLDALGEPEQQEEIEASAEEQEAPEGEEQAEEQEAEPEKPAVDQKFRVKVKDDDGNEVDEDLSLEELASGYLRNKRFTQGMQQQAAEAKERETKFQQAVTQTTQQAQEQIRALQALVLQAAAPDLQNVNWQQLAMEDPARYVQLQARQQQLSQVLGTIQAENQRLEQERQATIQQQREQAIKHSLEHLSKEIPGFNLKEAAPKLKEVGKKYGFSEDELSQITDGRAIHLLHDAMKWRELQTAKPKALQKVAEAPKVIKPSAPVPKKTNQAAADRLRKSGRVEDLAALL